MPKRPREAEGAAAAAIGHVADLVQRPADGAAAEAPGSGAKAEPASQRHDDGRRRRSGFFPRPPAPPDACRR